MILSIPLTANCVSVMKLIDVSLSLTRGPSAEGIYMVGKS